MSRILTVRWLKWGGTGMARIPYSLMVIVPAVLAALGGAAISAQDKYTVQVPGGLAFSEFKGYEDWQTVSVSKTEHAFAAILANPVMIDAYRLHFHGIRQEVIGADCYRCRPLRDATCTAAVEHFGSHLHGFSA
jgi:hypothetical protein